MTKLYIALSLLGSPLSEAARRETSSDDRTHMMMCGGGGLDVCGAILSSMGRSDAHASSSTLCYRVSQAIAGKGGRPRRT